MRCPIESGENLELVLDYGTPRMGKQEAAAFQQHLRTCGACSEAVAGQREVRAALDLWDAPPVSTSFNRQLYANIEQTAGWPERFLETLARAVRVLLIGRGVPIAAAACLLVTAGIWIEQRPAPNPPSVLIEGARPEQVVHALDDMEMLGNFDQSVRDGGNSKL
ncbi:MAG: hypothetical protein JO336_21880 [Acidobacteriia bacterium]|nr:hypothetical protein [Terriglobia bacterium]MBV8905654.1 hypothetical protein [Terriglobia bacterium]